MTSYSIHPQSNRTQVDSIDLGILCRDLEAAMAQAHELRQSESTPDYMKANRALSFGLSLAHTMMQIATVQNQAIAELNARLEALEEREEEIRQEEAAFTTWEEEHCEEVAE